VIPCYSEGAFTRRGSPRHRYVSSVINQQHPHAPVAFVTTVLFSSSIITVFICITFCSFAERLMEFWLMIMH
jgi:hypothetical protein